IEQRAHSPENKKPEKNGKQALKTAIANDVQCLTVKLLPIIHFHVGLSITHRVTAQCVYPMTRCDRISTLTNDHIMLRFVVKIAAPQAIEQHWNIHKKQPATR